MAQRKTSKLTGLIGQASQQGPTIEYAGVSILVAPPLSVAEILRMDRVRQSKDDDGGAAFLGELVTLFIQRAKDPETREPFAKADEREMVENEIPFDLLLEVLRCVSPKAPQEAAKN